MIKDLTPPWIYPTAQPVKAFENKSKNYLEAVYDFKTQKWYDLKGKNITIIGWLQNDANLEQIKLDTTLKQDKKA